MGLSRKALDTFVIRTDFLQDSTLTLVNIEPGPFEFAIPLIRKHRPHLEVLDPIQ